MTNMVRQTLKITNMHCTSCAMSIDMDLEDLEGVKQATTSFAKSETEVEFDLNVTSRDQIVSAIAKTGYKVG